jgi:hypothetical protein
MTVFWVVAPCSLVEVYRHFRGVCYIALMMEAASTSETSANFYQTALRNNPEDSHLHTCRPKNLKSHLEFLLRNCYCLKFLNCGRFLVVMVNIVINYFFI